MTRMIFLAAPAAALAFATPAMAQDAPKAAPAGIRVEALVGYDRAGIDGFHESGVLYGAGIGYDLATGGSVSLGVDGEVTDSSASKDGSKPGRDLYAGGRVNFAVSPQANLYVKAGYTNARVHQDGFGSANLDGFRAGVGGQYVINGKTYIGAEYRYSNYELGVDRHQVALTVGTRF